MVKENRGADARIFGKVARPEDYNDSVEQCRAWYRQCMNRAIKSGSARNAREFNAQVVKAWRDNSLEVLKDGSKMPSSPYNWTLAAGWRGNEVSEARCDSRASAAFEDMAYGID